MTDALRRESGHLAIAVEQSQSSKLGDVSATYASQSSCPLSCPLRCSGCYAEYGHVGTITRRLNGAGVATPTAVARQEVAAIRRLSGKRPLRIHVVGDAPTDWVAAAISKATRRWVPSAGGPGVWTYSHAWRAVSRWSWGRVSVLASCETPADVRDARDRGYAAALVVPTFAAASVYSVGGERVIPCPEMTGRAKDCASCRLCFDDARLKSARLSIAFAVHSAGRRRALDVLSS